MYKVYNSQNDIASEMKDFLLYLLYIDKDNLF